MSLNNSKLIFIHLFNDRSGSPKVLSQILEWAKRNHIYNELLTSTHKDGFLNTDNANKFIKIFFKRSENSLLTLFFYIITQTQLFFKCLFYKNQNVIFYINTMMPVGAALAGKIVGIPIVFHLHESYFKSKILKKIIRFIIKYTADLIIFVSNDLKEIESYEGKRQIVIHNALDNNFTINHTISEFQASPNCNDNCFQVLMVCSLKKYKGLNEFIDIANELLSYKSIIFCLVLNATEIEIKRFFHDKILPINITIHSRQTNIQSFYSRSKILLNLSRVDECVESFGLTILEALAFSLPVIAPPIGGPKEIVINGYNGFLISSYEIQKISKIILNLYNNPDYYKEMSVNAKKHSNKFSISSFEYNISTALNSIAC